MLCVCGKGITRLYIQKGARQQHVKDPAHSAKSASGRLQLNTHTPLTKQSRSGLTVLSMRSVGTHHAGKRAHTQLVKERSSTVVSFAEAMWTDPWPERVELVRAS